jgi:hypothetical protein
MGEISKWCRKHKWMMYWSTRGLENMLWILLVRYTDPAFYREESSGIIIPALQDTE